MARAAIRENVGLTASATIWYRVFIAAPSGNLKEESKPISAMASRTEITRRGTPRPFPAPGGRMYVFITLPKEGAGLLGSSLYHPYLFERYFSLYRWIVLKLGQ